MINYPNQIYPNRIVNARLGDTSVNRLTLQLIPLGGEVGKLQRFLQTPIDFKLGYYNDVESSERAPNSRVSTAV